MQDRVESHPTGEAIEAYSLGRLAGADLEGVEEHLLICERCQGRVAETDEFVSDVKLAAAALQRENPIHVRSRPAGGLFAGFRWFPKPVWAGALAAAALAVAIWIPRERAASFDTEVYLETTRGPESRSAAVPAGKPFVLRIDMAGLPARQSYRLEIATASGEIVWHRDFTRQGETALLSVSRSLPSGVYWVRVSEPGGMLLREYALNSR